jgi:hypothetical protein
VAGACAWNSHCEAAIEGKQVAAPPNVINRTAVLNFFIGFMFQSVAVVAWSTMQGDPDFA